MKKKTLALLLAISCALSMAACGASGGEETAASRADEAREELAAEFNEEESEPEEDEESSEKAATASGALLEELYDFQISIDGTVYQFPMWYADFEALGWEYEGDPTETIASGRNMTLERWNKDGVKVLTMFSNLSMNTVSLSESTVAGISFTPYELKDCGWEILLPGGIQWGVSGIDDIIAAYGDPSNTYDSGVYYSMSYELDIYRNIVLKISKEEGVLREIDIVNVVELEGLDNSVNEEVPDLVKEYKAPSSLGNDFYAYNVQIENILYSLPCPVSVFLENGFTIDTANSDDVVASGGIGWISLRYNNLNVDVTVRNYADYATIIENCFVTSIMATIYRPDLDMVFPGNLKPGDSEDALKKAIDGFNCEVMPIDSSTFYMIYNPDISVVDGYTFIVEDGSIESIQIENSARPEY